MLFKNVKIKVMEKMEGQKYSFSWQNELVKISIAGVFALFDYFYLFLAEDLNLSMGDILNGTFLLAKNGIEKFSFASLDSLPLIVFWSLVGVMAYLFYYSLQVIYYDVFLITKTKKVVLEDEQRKVRIFVTRATAHLLVIFIYLILILTSYLFLLPLARLSFLIITQAKGVPFGVAFLGPVLVWYAALSVLVYLYKKTTLSLSEEEYWETHNLTA